MPRFQIDVDDATFEALAILALEERRRPADQAAWLLQQAMKARCAQAVALRHLEGEAGSASVQEGP